MEQNKKPHLDFLNSLSKSTLIANLYGKLFMLKDMQLSLLKQEKELEEQIKKVEYQKIFLVCQKLFLMRLQQPTYMADCLCLKICKYF